jgi:hypothetical protein
MKEFIAEFGLNCFVMLIALENDKKQAWKKYHMPQHFIRLGNCLPHLILLS